MREHVAIGRQAADGQIGPRRGRRHTRQTPGRARVALLAALICLGMLALGASSAQALLVHTTSFGSAGAGAGQFNSPQGVTIDQSNGDVYVVDAGNFRVEKFDPSGTFILAFGKGVDQTTGGNVCTAASGDTCQAGTQGTAAGEFQNPLFVAVDNSAGASKGDVYVGDRGEEAISKFDSSGNLITGWGTGGQLSGTGSFGSIDGITVDGSGNLFVINDGNPVFEFAQDGSAVKNFASLRGMSPLGLDVNNSGVLFKVNGDTSVERFDPSGPQPPPDLQVTPGGTTELVIDRSSGDLYQDTGTSVSHYVFDPSGNVVETGGTTCTIPPGSCAPTDTFGSGVLSSGTGIGFDSATTTAFVADAGNNDVAVFGPPSPGKPVVDSESASNINQRTATVSAEVNPFGVDTNSCQFQYVDATDFASGGFGNAATVTVPCTPSDLGSTFADQLASANLTGLTLNTTYDFRVVATNADGTTDGNPATFTTLGAALVDSESATNIAATSATLNTQINPLGTDTMCEFQYVDDADFTSGGAGFSSPATVTVPCTPADLGAGSGDVGATAQISGLAPNTLYDFRAVATNSLGTVDGTATQFTTAPPLVIDSESASNVGAASATLNTQINPEGLDTTCQFQYVDDADFTSGGGYNSPATVTVPCTPADLGSGTSDVAATANLTGLQASTTYHFRAVGINSLAPGPAGFAGPDMTFTTTPPSVVDSESAANVTDRSATLKAEINPEGVDTHYQFQFGTDSSFSSGTVPARPVDIGSGMTDQAASVDLTGLQPSTTYHFRVVATNSAGTVNGPDRTFKTLASVGATGLPDNRAYEMVSPVNKADGEVLTLLIIGGDQAAASGDAVGYMSFTSFPGSVGPGINELATRGATGWSTQPLMPRQAPGSTLELPGYLVYSTDLSKALLSNGGGSSGGTSGQDDPPLDPGTCTGSTTPTTPCTGEPSGIQNLFVRNNSDRSFQLVDSLAQAPSGVTPAAPNLQGVSADLSHVVFDEGASLTASAPMGQDSLYVWSGGTLTLLGTGARLGGSGRVLHAVSDDGSRIFFTDSSGNLNLFQNGSASQVDKTQGGSGPGGGGQFMTAATDGSVVFFTDGDGAGLTSNTMTGSGNNLYEYNVATGKLTDLTGNQSSAVVDGVLGASSDGSFVYFVAEGALTGTTGATSGQENLYVEHNGTTTFVATLSGSDSSDWNSQGTARVTPDGTHLAFDSVQSLTGFDNTDANTGSPDTEVFLYDATSSTLACASCNPTGVRPIGSSSLDPIEGGLLGGGNQYLQHNLSDDGSRLFFDSNDALSPRDTNGKQDVYEYENGQPHLISTGTGGSNSIFLDASSSGNDVFFITRDQLVRQDTDGQNDLYDARVNGGFPTPPPTPPCTGDACKPGTTPPPSAPTLATISFVGPGNPTPPGPPTIPTPKVKASTKVLKGFKFSVNVRAPGKGKITISGAGLKTVKKSVGRAGTFKLTVGLTSAERTKLRKEHKLKLKITVHVGFTAASGKSSSATFSVTVKA
jgi:NHL repeat